MRLAVSVARGRIGAVTCKKRWYKDEIAAKLALSKIIAHGDAREKTPRNAYRCPDCGRWHLTSKK